MKKRKKLKKVMNKDAKKQTKMNNNSGLLLLSFVSKEH